MHAHHTCDTIELLRCTTADFIAPDMLQQRTLHLWCSLEQLLIDDAVNQWPTRLACLCSYHRGHFEHILTINLFSLYLMNFMLRTMLDAAADVLEMHYKSIKYHCDVLLFTS